MYNFGDIDKKWQKIWQEKAVFAAKDGDAREKFYALVEFPYPSGAGLHVGHPRSYTAIDVIARYKRMSGFNVLYPMGWDAFGLPAENYAIKTGIHPAVVTAENCDTFRRQLQSIGFSFDWSREVNTTDPAYYKWTQWMFLEFFKAGLAYKAKMPINWCPKDKVGLANEEVIGGCCERCGAEVEKKEKEQWMIAITKYADRLLADLDTVDYLPKIKKQQQDWIGKSEGAEIDFLLHFDRPEDNERRGPSGERAQLAVFTTRPDTLYGVTYIVLAPEHPWVTLACDTVHDVLLNKEEVQTYVAQVKNRAEDERTAEGKEKSGVELKGVKAINPATGEHIPMYVADYVLPQYGTGVVMAVPAHDERDFAFAQKYGLPVKEVVLPVFTRTSGSDAVRPELPFVERHAVVCVVKHWSEDKYLCLKSTYNPGWQGFVIGGIEAGETAAESGAREILEETGYAHARFVRELGNPIIAEFFHQHKGVNRRAWFHGALFELTDGERVDIAADEQALASLVWVSSEEVMDFLTREDMKEIWRRVENPQVHLPMTAAGFLAESEKFTDRFSEHVFADIVAHVGGRAKTTYRLRDWVFSRQRYWGEPIPLVHCEKDGWVAIPAEQLPVTLPQVEKYQPTDTGESPLSAMTEWVNTTCPQCGGPATRETDTMPNWAGSSWYFLRYCDPHNDREFASMDKLTYWLPVDLYNGGMEHTTLHLLYSRFWTKFLFDRGLVPVSEPYARRHSHGLILADDGTKMSKSKGNVVNPDDIVREYGADTLRVYELFMGPFEEPVPWSMNGVVGVKRFLDKAMKLTAKVQAGVVVDIATRKALHRAIAKISVDIAGFRFNTAVAALMTLVNAFQEAPALDPETLQLFARVLSPFAPHVAGELWVSVGGADLVDLQAWPEAQAQYLVDDTICLAVQVNGKMRGNIEVPTDASEEAIVLAAKADENVAKYLVSEVKKTIVVKGKIVSFVL
jgi:leucyl-tRNA synthetase